MWQRYSALMADTEVNTETQRSVEHEVMQYFLEPLEPHNCNVWNFWKVKRLSVPRLGNVANKFLSAPPATVFSERLFSTSGIICDKKRNRLDPHRVQMIIMLEVKNILLDFISRKNDMPQKLSFVNKL
ncbi:zinc finger BED domain-containing protein 4-like [Macrosteles quadrilineatus]|uniref:zinc finger BED domain-containing protein 4-like n=1 Tax=Macrosteles quadrilineatus TaxID=74068 RepID=UPI0023E0CE29|nr:zinc finger BED domain-containing protein 4-like [Macrosteles quadrilineatus]